MPSAPIPPPTPPPRTRKEELDRRTRKEELDRRTQIEEYIKSDKVEENPVTPNRIYVECARKEMGEEHLDGLSAENARYGFTFHVSMFQ